MMSGMAVSEGASTVSEKPVECIETDVKFPPFPEPTDQDYDEEISNDEKAWYKSKFSDLSTIVTQRLHCTACDRHLGTSSHSESRIRMHPMLRTLVCVRCHSFYNSGEFDKGDDGSELYCRWCGQGGQVYCCSDCPHVFCAKCIKRNMGMFKIKEIENTDDWKCFKCKPPQCLWDLRAVCWALLRYCDLRNQLIADTIDSDLREKYVEWAALDLSECCKSKARKRSYDSIKKEKKDADNKKVTPKAPIIQVKKFASINVDDFPKVNDKTVEKKVSKRSTSPKQKLGFIKNPIAIAPCAVSSSTPLIKKIRMSAPIMSPVRYEKKQTSSNIRSPRPKNIYSLTNLALVSPPFNGFNSTNVYNNSVNNVNNFMNDNINLSLDTLTQGLDMTAVPQLQGNHFDGDLVCTPDLPLEPLCEVMEDNDDDVECITPGPVAAPKPNPPPVPRAKIDITNKDNIVQMTDNDVTVNALTGGLKFRVDPQTLSSNKMYRLPDGRIFAINVNPNMPGGYSATIVSVADGAGNSAPSGATYAAKLSEVAALPTLHVKGLKSQRKCYPRKQKFKRAPKNVQPKSKESNANTERRSDFKVPVEWYRYNLIDAVDALEYSLTRLQELKKEATTSHLRSRSLDEMKYLHRSLEQLLSTSSKRFLEIRSNLNNEMQEYISKKNSTPGISSANITEEEDDVEILPNVGDDPIFIDENSSESANCNHDEEVDLTGTVSSEHNDSTEGRHDVTQTLPPADNESDPLNTESAPNQPILLTSSTVTNNDVPANCDSRELPNLSTEPQIKETNTEVDDNTNHNEHKKQTEDIHEETSKTDSEAHDTSKDNPDKNDKISESDHDKNNTEINGNEETMLIEIDAKQSLLEDKDNLNDIDTEDPKINLLSDDVDTETNEGLLESVLKDANNASITEIQNE